MRRLVVVVLVVVTTSGCLGMTRRHRGRAAVADVMAVGGLVLIAKNAGCEPTPRAPDEPPPVIDLSEMECLGQDFGVAGGIALLGIGAIIGATILADEAERRPDEQVSGPVVSVTPGPALVELPPGRVDAQTMQLAKQARRATAANDCAAARASLASVARRDPAYHAALVESAAVAGCR